MNLVALGDIANFSQGLQIPIPDQKKDEFPESQLFLRIINYTQQSKDFRYVKKQKEKYRIDASDIIMVRYGAVGFVGRGLSGILANNMFKIDFNQRNVNGDYLFWTLKSDYVQIQLLNGSQSTSMAAINFKSVAKVKLPLPPLEEQKKIAAILDAADDYRQKTKALIDKYDQLTQSLFLDMFGDPVTNPKGWDLDILNNICSKITDGTHDSPPRLEHGVKFITGKHIRPYVIDYENSDYVDKEIHDIIYKRCNPEFGDVLYTNIGANLGTAAMNIVNYEFSMKNVALLKPINELITGKYIEFFLNSYNMKEKVLWIGSQGGAQQFLSLTQLRKFMINLPPISLQNQFAERVAQIEKQKQQAEASLVKAADLFSSLLQRAFKGDLTS